MSDEHTGYIFIIQQQFARTVRVWVVMSCSFKVVKHRRRCEVMKKTYDTSLSFNNDNLRVEGWRERRYVRGHVCRWYHCSLQQGRQQC